MVEYPLALAIKSLNRSEIGRALPFLGFTFVLASLIPVSLRINGELGMPGAPLIAAKFAGDKIHFSIRSLARVSIGYAILAAAAGAGVLVIVIVPLVLICARRRRHQHPEAADFDGGAGPYRDRRRVWSQSRLRSARRSSFDWCCMRSSDGSRG